MLETRWQYLASSRGAVASRDLQQGIVGLPLVRSAGRRTAYVQSGGASASVGTGAFYSAAPVRRPLGVCRSPRRRAGSHVVACGGRAPRPASLPRRGRVHLRSRPLRSSSIVRPPPISVSAIRMLIGQTHSRCAPPLPHPRLAVHRERPTGRHMSRRELCGV